MTEDPKSKQLAIRDGHAAVRTWTVDLPPADVILSISSAENIRRHRSTSEPPIQATPYHQGEFFVEERPDGLALWRRPSESRFSKLSTRDPVVYPDVLRLRVLPHPAGSQVIATWEPHPLTRRIRRQFPALVALLVGSIAFAIYSAGGLLMLPWFAAAVMTFAVGVQVVGLVGLHTAKSDLLHVAYGPLASHEVGDAGTSVFRS